MSIDDPDGFPNVHARLHRTRRVPGTPEITTEIRIWLAGSRFRIRDGDGRSPRDLIGDVAEPPGFGLTPRTVGEFMTAASVAARPGEPPTDICGDFVTGLARVHEPRLTAWELPAASFLPVVDQLFAPLDVTSWRPAGKDDRISRTVELFDSERIGESDGFRYHTRFRWAVAEPFVLSRHVRDSSNPGMFLTVDVMELAEGMVTDAELTAPEIISPAPR